MTGNVGPSALVKAVGIAAALVVLILMAVLVIGGSKENAGTGNHMAGSGEGSMHQAGNDTRPLGHHGGGTDSGNASHGGASGPEGRRAPVTWTVELSDNRFMPAALTIQAGDTVRWVHNGSNAHTVTEDEDAFDGSPDCTIGQVDLLGQCMAQGDAFEQTFNEAGQVAYHCKVHESMTGSIDVLERYDEEPERLES